MNIMEFIRNIVFNVIKVKVEQYYMGIVCNHRLYLIVDDTILIVFDLSDKIANNINLTFTPETIKLDALLCDSNIFNEVFYKAYNYMQISNRMTAYFANDNLRNDPQFEEMLQQKASDGTSFYFVEKYGKKQFIPISKSLFTLNKGDAISGYINIIDEKTDLCTFHIIRKKAKISYTILFRILDLYQ